MRKMISYINEMLKCGICGALPPCPLYDFTVWKYRDKFIIPYKVHERMKLNVVSRVPKHMNFQTTVM
jgi:hypothetical protein